MTLASRILDDLAPYMEDDDGTLPMFVGAATLPLEDIDAIVQATDEHAGYTSLLDVDRAPADYLQWLGQAVGVRVPRGTAETAARSAIRTPSGWRRGTLGAIKDAVAPTLTGTQTVIVLERTAGGWAAGDNPYHLTVATFTDETPDAAATTAAALSQKPAGNIMSVVTISHWVYITLLAGYATYDAVKAAFATYDALKAGP